MELSTGKHWRMRRLADADGFLTMLAVDQRPPIERLVAEARGERVARPGDVADVKRLLVDVLAPEASAVLVDPLVGYDAARDRLDPHRGLLLTLEHAVFDEEPGGRRSGPIPGWNVETIAAAGADGVKVLAWYRPDADDAVREHQVRWAASVGEECRRLDLPYVLELLVYPMEGRPEFDDVEGRAGAVLESVRTFADPVVGVDLFKLESPVPPGLLAPPDTPEGRRHQRHFRALDEACGRPWVVLSAGAGRTDFLRVVEHAATAGASGYLAGRAIWHQALSPFPDLEACRGLLTTTSVPFARELTALTRRLGHPWHAHRGYGDGGSAPTPIMESR